MESKEKFLSSNILDLIDPSDKHKIEEFFPYIKCKKCLEVGLEPRQCSTCNFVLCQKCKICSHPLIQSRHVKLILENLSFKCKFNRLGCTSTLKYFDIRRHLLNCKYLEDQMESQNRSNNQNESLYSEKNSLSKSSVQKSQSVNNSNMLGDSALFSGSNFYQKEFDGKIDIKCVNCGDSYSNKNEFLAHFKSCANNKSQEDTLGEFRECHGKLEKKFQSYIQDKLNERKCIQANNFNQYDNLLNNKRNEIREIEEKISKLSSDDNTKYDLEYMEILKRESMMDNTKSSLHEILNKKIEDYNKIIQLNEKELEMTIFKHKNILIELELEEKWLKEDLESTMFCTDFGDKCIICGNGDQGIKKYFCESCKGKFCADKCAKICETKDCDKFICPKEGDDCKLCHKLKYCNTCRKKCFYEGCAYTFCPECYKKNEHQARNTNTNCKFFTCEKDKVCDCLLTTLFCSKCNKRLCNKCVMNDKEHFPFLE